MSYPVGPLLRTLATRIVVNLDVVEAQAPKPGEGDQESAPFSDTQLLLSLLGTLVFPHARTREVLGKLLCEYDDLPRVLTVHHSIGANQVEITSPDGTEITSPDGTLGQSKS